MEEEQAKKEFAVIEEEVLNWVADIDLVDLVEISAVLELDVDDEVKAKRNSLLKLILKYLLSLGDADDGGYASYKLIHERYVRPLNDPDPHQTGDNVRQTQDPPHFTDQNRPLTSMQLPPLGIGIGAPNGNGGSGRNYQSPLSSRNNPSPPPPRNPVRTRSVFDVKKLKDFKINGTIGGTEKEGKLAYSSLLYQIQNGQKLKYEDEDICAAVIRAISATDPLRTYFEMEQDLTLESVKKHLKNRFKEKDSAAYVAELCSATQNPEEACDHFVLRLLCLCQKIKALSIEEGYPYNEVALRKNLFRTIFTGMRNTNIRIDLRESCKRQDVSLITDEELLQLVAEAVVNEGERTDKLCNKKEGSCNVNQIDRSEKREEEARRKKESTVPAQIDAVKVAHDKSMKQLTTQIAAIQTALADQQKNFQQQLKEQREQQQQLLQEVHRRQWEQPPPPVHPGPAPQAPSGGAAANANFQPLGQQRYQPRRQYNRPKCKNCHESNAFRCFHCLYCCDGAHKISECETKKADDARAAAARNLNH